MEGLDVKPTAQLHGLGLDVFAPLPLWCVFRRDVLHE